MSRLKGVDYMPRNETYEEKEKRFMSCVNTSPKSINNRNKNDYMSDPNVKEFMAEMNERAFGKKGRGRPPAFSSIEQLEDDLDDYIDLCRRTNTTPTVASIALWLSCDRDTIYAHASNPNSIFSDTCKKIINMCHIALENRAIGNGMNSVLYMFLGKNYFGLKDDKNITVTPATSDSLTNSQETMDAIQKQIEEENIPNAEFTEH